MKKSAEHEPGEELGLRFPYDSKIALDQQRVPKGANICKHAVKTLYGDHISIESLT